MKNMWMALSIPTRAKIVVSGGFLAFVLIFLAMIVNFWVIFAICGAVGLYMLGTTLYLTYRAMVNGMEAKQRRLAQQRAEGERVDTDPRPSDQISATFPSSEGGPTGEANTEPLRGGGRDRMTDEELAREITRFFTSVGITVPIIRTLNIPVEMRRVKGMLREQEEHLAGYCKSCRHTWLDHQTVDSMDSTGRGGCLHPMGMGDWCACLRQKPE